MSGSVLIAQWIEQLTPKRKVGGSNPPEDALSEYSVAFFFVGGIAKYMGAWVLFVVGVICVSVGVPLAWCLYDLYALSKIDRAHPYLESQNKNPVSKEHRDGA